MTDIPSATLQLLKFPLFFLTSFFGVWQDVAVSVAVLMYNFCFEYYGWLSNHTEATLKGMQATSCQIEKSNFISVFILLLCVVNITMM